MPELPEVETVRRTLKEVLMSKTIKRVSLFYPKLVQHDPQWFSDQICHQTIRDIKRKGKHLIFILDHDAMLIHLRMEGKFFIKDDSYPILKHEHIVFTFESGQELRYHDVRKFGTIHLHALENYESIPPLSKIAPEPKDIDVQSFYQLLVKKQITIKQALLDQTLISGLGNIYVDETLFKSRIHPTRKTNQLSYEEVKIILKSANEVLQKAVELGGTTIRSYTSSLGVTGRFQNQLHVHMKKGEPCPICQTPIIKMKVGGRGTYVCPECQT